MEDKIKKLILSFLFILISFTFWAQENYYIQDTEDGAIFIQKFSWESNPDVLKYEFTIEMQNKKGKYEQINFIETTDNFVEISLSAGHYRYKIALYNFLGYKEYETPWYPVDVIKAYQPKISDVSPSHIYMEEVQDGVFVVDGYELRPETEFVLKNGSTELRPVKVENDSKNKKVKLYFDPNAFDTGNWTLIATNIGGLKFSYNPIKIQFKKPFDFDLSGGYAFMYLPSSYFINDIFPQIWNTTVSPLGLSLRATFIPVKKKTIYYGFSLNLFNYFFKNSYKNWTVSSIFTIASLDFNIQWPFLNKKLFLDLHFGFGASIFYDLHIEFSRNIKSPSDQRINPNLDLGISLFYYPAKRLYISVGLDTTLMFDFADSWFQRNDNNLYMWSIIPTLEIGYQF